MGRTISVHDLEQALALDQQLLLLVRQLLDDSARQPGDSLGDRGSELLDWKEAEAAHLDNNSGQDSAKPEKATVGRRVLVVRTSVDEDLVGPLTRGDVLSTMEVSEAA